MALLIISCDHQIHNQESMGIIQDTTINETIALLKEKNPEADTLRIVKGVKQAAAFWTQNEGSEKEFSEFCINHFAAKKEEQKILFGKLSGNLEIIYGHFHMMNRALTEPLHLDTGPITDLDVIFGSYSPSAHLSEDFFINKVAFITLLNFPYYTLQEKNEMGNNWDRLEWAYVRMGDVFTKRVPPSVLQKASDVSTEADNYIAEYNIMMGPLVDNEGNKYFPEDLKLITHWGLRDEIKSNYNRENGLKKQQMIYQVMKRIIDQSIPEKVINNAEYLWNPFENILYKEGNEVPFQPEPDTRYAHLLNSFRSMKEIDPYSPFCPDFISRKFDQEMQIPLEYVEELFTSFISSPQTHKVAEMIKTRLGRELQPFDIWYDGFKPRSSFSPEMLDALVNKKYPTKDAFEKDIPNILVKLGFSSDKAADIASHITVDPARGAGHAWGAAMKGDKAHLRTRIGNNGMDYKGYNIAVHELGHNVEQTITLYDVDHYILNGVPNTGFTEAVAFIFQMKDLEILGLKSEDQAQKYWQDLDLFWGIYEIMGVSLVDMEVWKWLYQNPQATPQQLKEKVIEIAIETWNKYYAPVFGISDQPLLAIYSHMISNPLYLSAYPLGHLIEFQTEEFINNKNTATELHRMLTAGNITPQYWMKQAVNEELSVEPMLKAVDKAIEELK